MAEQSLRARQRTVKRFQEEQVWASGKFTVDAEGRIWRDCRRAEHRLPTAYLQVKVMVGGVRYYTVAHRLVWRAIRGPIPHGLTVNHINGVKDDNRPENLELLTYSGNLKHAYRIGLVDEHGERNPAAKLTDADVEEIRAAYATGKFTQQELAEAKGVRHQQVSRIVRGERRAKQGGPMSRTDHRHNACEQDLLSGRFVGKKAAGRLLDGRAWDGFPEAGED